MGVYIPNMDKPKGCYECPIAKSYLDCLMEKKYVCPIGHTDDCQLIDIVQCKDCKWCEKRGGILWCNIWHDDTNGLNFCSYAERRADGDI